MGRLIVKATHGTRWIDTLKNEVVAYKGDYYISLKSFETGDGICAISSDGMSELDTAKNKKAVLKKYGYTRDKLRKEVKECLDYELNTSVSDEIVDSVCVDVLKNNLGEDVMTTLDCFTSSEDYLTGIENDIRKNGYSS